MGLKAAYPYSDEDDRESNVLMAELQTLVKREDEIKKRLRQIIYSIEAPR